MAAATSGSEDEIMSAINITPLVDIFLVLLIIFMITSSVVDQKSIPVNLPKAAHAGTEAPKASGLLVDKDHRLFLDLIEFCRVALEEPGQMRRTVRRRLGHQQTLHLVERVTGLAFGLENGFAVGGFVSQGGERQHQQCSDDQRAISHLSVLHD